ncbi:peroxide stress protein YaaA [Streptococcus cuniculipharyngis]|uniref:UPF0246 protein FRX57_06080 n=1 Tax=Streptococcus cuniculipharyngis TaxID=1562651 RepID=A0A5C5SB97_9STRE|nr:peroxide stress protein YaaA [Streptococcus cuniculipharyngis]TWS97161.1 peroxide stress protein YaaA [Streptococcus cuniculipharyngis]
MKYLIPTAKEMAEKDPIAPHPLSSQSKTIIQELAQYSPDQLAKLYKIKAEASLLEEQRWQELAQNKASSYPAIQLFNGLMYRQLDPEVIQHGQDFLQNQVFITSALYGVIPANFPIQPHRLDFNCSLKVTGKSLKHYWRTDFDQAVEKEPVVSLLSSEFETVFSPKIAKQFIRISFQEEKDGQLKTHSTISKKGRGLLLNQVIQHQVTDLETIKQLNFAGFAYAPQLSEEYHLVFVKTVN